MANLISMAIEGRNDFKKSADAAIDDLHRLRREVENVRPASLKGILVDPKTFDIPPVRIPTVDLSNDIKNIQRLFVVGKGEATQMARKLQDLKDSAERARIRELLNPEAVKDGVQGLNLLRDAASGALSQLGSVGRLLAPVAAVAGPVTVLGAALVGVSAASVQVATAFARDVQALENLSRRTGIAIEDVQALQRALTNAGASPDAFVRPLQLLNRQLAENSDLVQQLGLSGLAPLDALRKLLGVLAASPDVVKRNEVANRLLGQSYGELVGVAAALGPAFDKTRDRLRELGLVAGEDVRRQLADLRAESAELRLQWDALWNNIRQATVGPAQAIVKALNDIAESARTGIGPVGELVGVMRKLNDLSKAPTQFVVQQLFPPDAARQAVSGDAFAAGIERLKTVAPQFIPQLEDLVKALDKINFGDEGESPREKRIKQLRDLLGITAGRAAELEARLLGLEQTAQIASLAEQFRRFGGNIPQELFDRLGPAGRQSLLDRFVLGPTELPPVSERVKAEMGLIRETLDGFTAASAEAPRGGQTGLGLATALLPPPEQFQQIGAELESIAHATGRGIQAGLTTAFVNLTNQAQTFRGAMVSIFQAMVQEILAALAKLATVALGKLLLNIGTGGGSGFIEAIGRALVGSAATPVSGGAQRLGSAGEFAIQPQQGNTFIIQSIDSRSVLDDLLSPTGSFRRANDRLAELGAVA